MAGQLSEEPTADLWAGEHKQEAAPQTVESIEPAATSEVSHYRLISKIGEGGMGRVYRARDLRLDRDVAIKILSRAAGADPQARARLLREARIAASVNHPNIVTIHEVGTTAEDIDFIVMEHVSGFTLAERIRRGAIPLDEAIDIAIQTAQALAAAHGRGVTHRDLKPGNILVTETGQVKVLDFGLATHCQRAPEADSAADDPTRSIEGLIAGTPAYMSPEQAQGKPVDARSDIFSFGCVLFEMLTRRRAFSGDSALAVMYSVVHEEPRAIREFAPEAPEQLERVVARALVKAAESRVQTMADVLVALLHARDRQPGELPSKSRPRTFAGRSLPIRPTPLIGRAKELADIETLLRDDDVRLVNVTGPGGIGKTRLAVEICHQLADSFEFVCFVELETVTESTSLPGAILRCLDSVDEADRGGSLVSLVDALRPRQALLVLDNFEQLTEAARSVAELLSRCSRLKILVTSRSVLHLRIEHEYPLSPLAVRQAGVDGAWHDIPAVALFLERARLANPTEDVCRSIAEVCARLDGLPLAIELAAARARILSPRMILARLEDRFEFLSGGALDLPDRQRTLRRAIDWSYDLLNPDEQLLFQASGVFSGGFSVEAMVAVADPDVPGAVDVLLSLSDKSLIRHSEDDTGEVRMWMLETLREYARERLQESPHAPALRARHAAHYLQLVERAAARRAPMEVNREYDTLEIELGNCRVALDWLIETRETPLALRMSIALWPFWERRGHWAEGREHLSRVLGLPFRGNEALRGKALHGAGILADAQGDYAAARVYFGEHLAAERAKGDDPFALAATINNLAVIAVREGDFGTAREMYLESLEILRRLDCHLLITQVHNNLGNLASAARDYVAARNHYTQSIRICEEQGLGRELAWTVNSLGNMAADEGNTREAQELCARGLSIFTELHDDSGVACSMADLGSLAWRRADFFLASQLYQESLVIYGRTGDKGGIARVLDGFASIANSRFRPADALRLRGAASSIRNRLRVDPFQMQKTRYAQDPSASMAAGDSRTWTEGAAMSIEAAIQFALSSVADLIH